MVSPNFRRSKWLTTVASIWLQTIAGSSYCFGIYSPLLKSTQNYSQSTLDTVAFFKDIGANAGVLSGLLYSAAGPLFVIFAGAIQCFAGFFMTWLSVTGRIARQPVPLMCLYMFLAAHGQTFYNTTDVVVGVENFPMHRGTVVGIMKGFLGLSGAILIQFYRTLLNGKQSNFILMLGLLQTVLGFLLMLFVSVNTTHGENDKKLLDGFSLIALVTAGYLMVVIIWENLQIFGSIAYALTSIALLIFLASPVIVAVKGHLGETRALPGTSFPERLRLIDVDFVETEQKSELMYAPEKLSNEEVILSREENVNLLNAIQTFDFWLLFIAMACGMGSGLATVNNIGQIGGSLGYTSLETSTLVSLWSIWNFLGRFGMGYVSDYFLCVQGYSRPLFMVITQAIMILGHLLVASGLPGTLYIGSTVLGVCYGSQWSLMPTISSEIYGIRHFGTIFNTIAAASPTGSYILSVRVVGYIYDMETPPGSKVCKGRRCFMSSFLIMASVSLLGTISALTLFLRNRKFYKEVIYVRLQRLL